MSLRLADLHACFEGVIPSIVATVAPDGTPNISYLSHVVAVDAEHVALSNQFFGKTAQNLETNPRAAILVVDGRTGAQFRLETLLARSEGEGRLFDEISGHLAASSAQVGMDDVMRLKAVDVFRVLGISMVASPVPIPPPQAPPDLPRLESLARIAAAIVAAAEIGEIVEAVLSGISAELAADAVTLLIHDPVRSVLTTLGSHGYPRSGIGSEVGLGSGLAGRAAAERRIVKVSDLSRVRRFGAAIRATAPEEEESRTIPPPGMPGALSQIAAPLLAQGRLVGAVLAESRRRFAFGPAEQGALAILANLAAAALALADTAVAEPAQPRREPPPRALGPAFRVTHHRFDDSVFIDGNYIIKGVAGRLLVFLLRLHASEGRTEFSNREIRLADALRLPEFNDNLETRLLLLQRRLDEKDAPVRLVRPGRGRLRIELTGTPRIASV